MIDNELADVKLDTDIRLTGELRKPRVEGFVEVENGFVDVARVLELATADAYATEATEINPALPAPAGPAPTAETSSVFDALADGAGDRHPEQPRAARHRSEAREYADRRRGHERDRWRRASAPQERRASAACRSSARSTPSAATTRSRAAGSRSCATAASASTGGDEIDPIVDLRARRVISGVETIVRVQGSMRMPELTFSSNPPLEQADILSLIVFNAPINELGEGQQVSLAQRATALAGGYLTSGLSRSIADALELDEFEIQAQGEQGSGPSLTVGEQVGEKLFFRVRQGFGDAAGDRGHPRIPDRRVPARCRRRWRRSPAARSASSSAASSAAAWI